MIVLLDAIMVFPFAYLPYLYVMQHRFDSELAAITVITIFELLMGVMLPFGVAIMRIGVNTVDSADDLAFLCRMVPVCTLS